MNKIISYLIFNPYFLIALGVMLIFSHGYAYLKGREHVNNKIVKQNIKKGVENVEVLSNRPDVDEFLDSLRNGDF